MPRKPKPKPKGSPWPIRLPTDAAALAEGCYFDPDAADHVCDFIEQFCCHSTHPFAGLPFLLEAWQRDFLRTLYGWKRADGTRRFREAYLEVPKKNGKSTMLSAMAIYGLVEEPGAQVYPGAVDRAQAGIIFNECANMIRHSPDLSKHLQIIDSKKRIVFAARNAFIAAMSADVPNKDGLNSSLTILDELHRFKSPALYDVMKYAGAARAEPILAIITTAGHDRKSICYEQHERALAVINGTNPDTELLPVIYAAQEGDDLDALETWMKANPSMGTVLKLEDFRKAHKEAKLLPRLWAAFLRLRLNVWTEQVTRWIPLDKWDRLKDDSTTWDTHGAECYAAIDTSSNTDLTCVSFLYPPAEGEVCLSETFYFMPKDTAAARAHHDKVPYPAWIKAGHMIQTEGDTTDDSAIRLFLGDYAARNKLKVLKVGIDPWNARQLANQLKEDGFEVFEYRQGYASLSYASKAFERHVLAGTMLHDGNPVTTWCVGNAAVEMDAAGNIKPSKKRSAEKIDGLVTIVMTVGLYSADAPEARAEIRLA